jgi:hypothetical protein
MRPLLLVRRICKTSIKLPKSDEVDKKKREQQPLIAAVMTKHDREKHFLDYILAFAIPFERCESELFRRAHLCAPKTSKTLRDRVEAHAKRRIDEALAHLRGKVVTIAYDSGTV